MIKYFPYKVFMAYRRKAFRCYVFYIKAAILRILTKHAKKVELQ